MPCEKPPMRRLAASARPDLVEHRQHARSRYAEGAGQDREMADRRAPRMPDMGVEQGADETARLGQVAIASAAEERGAGGGLDESEQARSVVVLPAPFGPRKPTIEPRGTVKLTSWTAW